MRHGTKETVPAVDVVTSRSRRAFDVVEVMLDDDSEVIPAPPVHPVLECRQENYRRQSVNTRGWEVDGVARLFFN